MTMVQELCLQKVHAYSGGQDTVYCSRLGLTRSQEDFQVYSQYYFPIDL